MKKLLLHRIREGEFNPSKSIQNTIDTLNTSYGRAKKTVERMHSQDEITLEESMTREFLYYSREIQKIKLKQFEDEHNKMFVLRNQLIQLFDVDVWDEVLLNCECDTLEDFYESYKLYVRNNHV
jgi:hypothetical protein